jgi:hypothetical protein
MVVKVVMAVAIVVKAALVEAASLTLSKVGSNLMRWMSKP